MLGIIAMIKAKSKEKYARPRYEVLCELEKNVELRLYAPRIIAQVAVSGEEKSALNEGFRILAGYIFGKNNRREGIEIKMPAASGHETIPMTAPVTARAEKISMSSPVTSSNDTTTLTVRFFMPPSYTLATLPEPQDSRIKLLELPEERYAAIRFSGTWNPSNFSRHAKTLLECLNKKNIKIAGDPVNAYYDPPYMLPPFRHNEVLIPIWPS